jgi:tetratricopeptide (TPR) repeat protein
MRKHLAAALREQLRRSQHAPIGSAVTMGNTAVDLVYDYQRTGHLEPLDAAIELFRDALAIIPPDHPNCLMYLYNLGVALCMRFERTGQQTDLDEAITTDRDALVTTPPNHADRPMRLSELGNALQIRFRRTGEQVDLDEAITVLRDAVTTTPPDHPNRPMYLSNLGGALRAQFERTDQQADLDKAITALRDAVTTTPPDHPDRPMYRSNLGAALSLRFGRTGQRADLDEAITALHDAVTTTPPDHPNRPGRLSNLSNTLTVRFKRTGQLADLDDAVTAGRDAVATTPPDRPDRPMYLFTLGGALQIRFGRTSQQADLDEAITVLRDAVATTPPDHPNRPMYLSALGGALRAQFGRTGQQADLDEAITVERDVVTTTPPDHPNRPMYLSNLGLALYVRFERTDQPADLHYGVTALRDAVATIPADHPDRPAYLSNLGFALHARFKRTDRQTDLDEAITAGRYAVATTPPDHPDRPRRLFDLGRALRTRFERTTQQTDLDDAITAFIDAVGVESGPPAVRIRASRAWGRAAIDGGRVGSAADGFASAVGLLPLLAWHGLPRSTREEHLAEWSGLAAAAAACAIRAGRPEQAVELLEAGRSVLWAQALNLRTDLTDLAQRAPAVATRLDQIRTLLNTSLPTAAELIPAGAGNPVEQLRAAQNYAVEDRIRLAREFDDLLTQVRTLDGFEHFLTPTPFTQLRAAATGGPVVIVNTDPCGCHALLVTTTGVRVVNLPNLTNDQAIDQANTLLGVLHRATQPDRSFLDRENDRHTVLDILGWLWDTVTGPVLTSLGHTSPPAPPAAWPRIWWCPTGPLTLLPLHAAGHHPRHQRTDNPPSTDTVADRVISSYTPTLTALLRARTAPAPAPTERPRLLAIGMPTTPGASDLPFVTAELDRIHARYPITTRLESPTRHQLDHGPPPDLTTQPITTRVLAELPQHPWVHLACHGNQQAADPTESAFWLTDGRLRIADLIEQHNPGRRELAFLSACQTAAGSPRALDEAIHLAAAMQLLGYRHIIATLWSIYDSPAPDIADTVYITLSTGTHTAQALHRAVTALRAQHPTEPLAWAPYLHAGP